MLPTLVIVGRPNVGKSTLFNVLTKTRHALVADQPGLTRDRQYGKGRVGSRDYWVIDTGGLYETQDVLSERVTQQALLAIEEADSVVLLVDGRGGLTATDENIARRLRTLNKPIYLAINKTENMNSALVSAEFHRLGLEHMYCISAAHGQGIETLIDAILTAFPEQPESNPVNLEENEIKVAIVGRPNAGKSTLINRLLGYERVIVFDQPGTTRDSIYIPFEREGQKYIFIDTAGVRRRARVSETVEKFSVVKTLESIEIAHVVMVLLNAHEGITDQDAHLLGLVLDSGRAVVIAVNKWDGLTPNDRDQVRSTLDRKLHFIDFASIHFISALHGSGVGDLFTSIKKAWQAAHRQINTTRLNEVLQTLVVDCAPPSIRGRRVKLRYIHQGGVNPPRFVIHGNQVDELPEAYKRYLINQLREIFKFQGTPIRLDFKQTANPFEGRKNPLTPRQQRKRQRLLRHVKR